jgi:O-antigen/teichoic acid export membrane protein
LIDIKTITQNSHIRELISGTSITFIFRLFSLVAGFFFYFIVGHFYGVEALGIWALAQTVLFVLSVLGRFGLDAANLRFVSNYAAQNKMDVVKEIYTKSITIVIPISILLSLLLFIFASDLAEHLFHKTILTSAFQINALALVPLIILMLHAEALRGLKKIFAYGFMRNISIFLIASLIIVFFKLFNQTLNAFEPVVAYAVAISAVALVSVVLWLKFSNIFSYTRSRGVRYKTIFAVSFPLLLTGSIFLFVKWTDTLMLGVIRTESDVGIYNVCFKIASLAHIPLIAVNSIAAPKFSELSGKNDLINLRMIVRQSTRFIFFLSLPILLPLVIFPTFFLNIFGTGFGIGKNTLLILVISQFLNAVSGSVGIILNMTGKQKIFQNIILSAAVLNIVLNLILIPRYGIEGAALSSAISMVYWNALSIVFIKKIYNIFTPYIPFFTYKKDQS